MNLTPDNYFSPEANRTYMSVSQYKSFRTCPAMAMAELLGEYEREQTAALLVGSYVDAWFEGTLPRFQAEHPAIFKRDGTLKADYMQAEAIIERVQRDPMFMDYMSGEKQVIMTGTIAGIKVKIKIDSLLPDKITDLKIMRDFAPIYDSELGRVPFWIYYGYDIQGAVYREIVRQNTDKTLPFYLASATKEKVTDIEIFHLAESDLEFALERFVKDAPMFDAIKSGVIAPQRCGCCEYCKQTKVLSAPVESDAVML